LQWFLGARAMPVDQWVTDVATQAAQWGAAQELEACCLWMERNFDDWDNRFSDDLRRHRRPKPPSLKEQALLAIDTAVADGRLSPNVSNVVRRALEQLDG
jgi:hypothetical protein